MTKRSNGRVPKKLLEEMLAILGYTLTRGEFMGRRRWMVTDKDGNERYFSSLKNIFMAYRNPELKSDYSKIESLVQRIRIAIS